MRKIGTTSAGAVIVEMTDAEFSRCEKALGAPVKRMTHEERVAYARERVAKSKPKTQEAAIHFIRDMFQFHGGVTTVEAEQVYAALKR